MNDITSHLFLLTASIILHCIELHLINRFPKQANLISEMFKMIRIIEILHLFGIL